MASTPSTIPQPIGDPSPEIDALVTRLRNRAEWVAPGRYSISSRYAPNESERHALTRRADDLRHGLIPATKEEIRTSLLKWTAGLDLKLSEEALDDMVSMFVASLMGLPLWAIRQALLNWMQGRIADCNPRFTPKPPELRREGNRIVGAFQRELAAIDVGLAAKVEPVPTDEGRERAVAYWSETVRPAMQHADVSDALSPVENRAEQLKANDRVRRRERTAAGANPYIPRTLDMDRSLARIRADVEAAERAAAAERDLTDAER